MSLPEISKGFINTHSSRSVADLELISRIVFGSASTNNNIPPLPFREVTLPKKLKFGYYTSGKSISCLIDSPVVA